jgi:hypothetical protein
MVVAEEAAVLGKLRADHFAELGVRIGAKRRVDAVERVMAFGGIDDDAAVRDGDRLGRPG